MTIELVAERPVAPPEPAFTARVVLPRHARPQPSPRIVPAGDCGACVLAGLLGTDVAEVYAAWCAGRRETIGWTEMRDVLGRARRAGWLDRVVDEVPVWLPAGGAAAMTWGAPGAMNVSAWFGYVRMALDAGYYAIASVAFDRQGPLGAGADHWVTIRGFRTRASGYPGTEILVSCSATAPEGEWCGVGDFLRYRGGFNAILARPVEGGPS